MAPQCSVTSQVWGWNGAPLMGKKDITGPL